MPQRGIVQQLPSRRYINNFAPSRGVSSVFDE
jgi:hypothetical protein